MTRLNNVWLAFAFVAAQLVHNQPLAQSSTPAQPANDASAASAEGDNPVSEPRRTANTTNAEATINLRTSISGNQEQPRVMYIMPWQSPRAEELGLEMLSSQQDAVFGHVERAELLRTLEQLEASTAASP